MMWCTRWFLPLILLPLPTAPPYLLLLFLFSLTMHARPCFYCIVLLTALFISSCYWQPLPIDTPLSTPWSANITTFSEALNAFTPDVGSDYRLNDTDNGNHVRRTVMKLMDRCWCDFSSGSFFDPFNVTTWELASVKRFKKELVLERERTKEKERERKAMENGVELEPESDGASSGIAAPTPSPAPRPSATPSLEKVKKGPFEVLRSAFWRAPSNASIPNPPSPSDAPLQEERRPVAPGELDLEPYGFDLVLDFRWTRPPS